MGTGGATWWLLGLPASYLIILAVLFGGLAVLVTWNAPTDITGPGLGPANRVTLLRAATAVPVGALALQPGPLAPAGYWVIILLSTVVLVLDGVDGRVARQTGTESAFGARFDMELDATLLMALSVLTWSSGKVGAWVLLIGLMRYLFIAASWIRAPLRAELPESRRRKVVCVVQGVVLLVALGPIIPASLAAWAAGAGLAMLTYSFAVDVRWLVQNAS